jgi:shikimate kinase
MDPSKTPPVFPLQDRCIAIVGMNGVGKSSFGRGLASALRLPRIDTDAAFRLKHGIQQAYIDVHGWEAFRKAEEDIVIRSLLPGHVVVLGGGAIESERIRSALAEKAVVLWIQGGRKGVHKNLRKAKVTRPEFADALTHASVKTMLDQRNPLYEDVADVALYPHLHFRDRVPMAVDLLRQFFAKR